VNAFIVELTNKSGELARITEAIAQKGIDLTGFAGATSGDRGSVVLLTNDEAGTRRALSDARATVREVEIVPASLENKPGSLAAAARRLADAGVNIDAAMPIGMNGDKVTVAFATSDPAKARIALGEAVPEASRPR
jgi:hypothetical protein